MVFILIIIILNSSQSPLTLFYTNIIDRLQPKNSIQPIKCVIRSLIHSLLCTNETISKQKLAREIHSRIRLRHLSKDCYRTLNLINVINFLCFIFAAYQRWLLFVNRVNIFLFIFKYLNYFYRVRVHTLRHTLRHTFLRLINWTINC